MLISTTTALFVLINSARTVKLKEDPYLTKLAEERCISAKEFSHKDFTDIYSKKILEKYKFGGENLAVGYANPETLFKALESSKTHRDNNHNKKFKYIGLSTCPKPANTGTIYLTVILFAQK